MKDRSTAATAAKDPSKWQSTVREYAKSILIALILALVIRAYAVQAYEIPSGSMEDTLAVGDRILVNKFIYGTKIPFTDNRILKIREPKRGDVVVFKFPKDPSEDYIKRIIGLPGDQILISDKKLYINGRIFQNPHEVHKDSRLISGNASPRDSINAITVPADSYFVMGDNRDSSYDSRFWGFVKSENLEGLAFIKLWSWDSENRKVRWASIAEAID